VKELDEKFAEVKEYVYDHPHVGIQEVSEVMEVSVQQIKQWIREERLAFADDSMIGLECESCGVQIKTGRFCKSCKDKLAKGLIDLYPEEKPPEIQKDARESAKNAFSEKWYKKRTVEFYSDRCLR
jgi:methionyl-tRNA synthetase